MKDNLELIKTLEEEVFVIEQQIDSYRKIITPLQNSIYQKWDEIRELRKTILLNSLELFISNTNYVLTDYNESKEKTLGCYFLYKNNEVIYIGISIDIKNRLVSHKNSGKDWDYVKYISCTDYLEVIKIESYYINKHKPKLNIQLGNYMEIAKNHGFKIDDELINYQKGWPDKVVGETKRSKFKKFKSDYR
jgi:hypothetical protein